MITIEACHEEVSRCSQALIRTAEWKAALEEWVARCGFAERLAARLGREEALYHQQLRIAISGCPNGCSRPQIADLGLVGCVRPVWSPEGCNGCGACAEVCPDFAVQMPDGVPVFAQEACQGCVLCRNICPEGCIRLSAPRVRILVGGKLGRRPQLAENIGEAASPAEVFRRLEGVFEEYLAAAGKNERFGDFWQRRKRGR